MSQNPEDTPGLNAAERWLFVAGLNSLALAVGITVMRSWPIVAHTAVVPLTVAGFLFLGIALKGLARKNPHLRPTADAVPAAALAAPQIPTPRDPPKPDHQDKNHTGQILQAVEAAQALPDRRREWPPLAPDQIAVWADALAGYRVSAFDIVITGPNSARLGKSIAEVAEQITDGIVKIQTEGSQTVSPYNVQAKFGDNRGVTFLTNKDYPGTPMLLGLLKSSGYHGRWDPQADAPNTIVLFIGEKF